VVDVGDDDLGEVDLEQIDLLARISVNSRSNGPVNTSRSSSRSITERRATPVL